MFSNIIIKFNSLFYYQIFLLLIIILSHLH